MSDAVSQIMQKYGVSSSGGSTKNSNDLNKDTFLNLLTTQMKYQDPLEPTKNEDFLAQMAQFTALEQMKNLNTNSEMQRGYSLAGKIVQADVVNPSTLQTKRVAGIVDAVSVKNGEIYLLVGDMEIELSKVDAVMENPIGQKNLMDGLKVINESLNEIKDKIAELEDSNESEESDNSDNADGDNDSDNNDENSKVD
jgi:flagellar hook assembly protein FlgD